MKQFKVIALSVSGRAKKIFKSGEIVSENNFIPGMAEKLCERNFLKPVDPIEQLPLISFPLKGKIKVAIVSSVWKRPEVFEMFAKGIHALEANKFIEIDIEFYIIIAGSEGVESQSMVEKHGFIYVEMPNDPLAAKVNQPVLIAKQLKVDYVLCLGSDDIISPELIFVYESYMRKAIDFIAVTDFYFYDLASKKAAYWAGYTDKRKGHTVGAGRLISSRLLGLWNWKPWDVKDSNGLDKSMQRKLKTTPHTSAIFSLKEKGVYALDIKSETNVTPFKLWPNTELIPVDELKSKFPFVI